MIRSFPITHRLLHGSGAIACGGALLVALLFMEGYLGLAPCPLCIIDRLLVALMGIIFAIAALHNPGMLGQRLYAAACGLLGALGIIVAARHVWLQNLPASLVPDCAPDLDYLIDNLPWLQSLSIIWNTSGNCAEVAWTFLGLSIAWQTLLLFSILFLLCLWVGLLRHPPTQHGAGP